MRAIPWLLLGACAVQAEPSPCYAVCDELYTACAYAAFPTYDSCLQGCVYWEDEGSDVERYRDCVVAAACDTFAIMECEHEHGLDASAE